MVDLARWQERIRAARGEREPDLVLTGARVADVYTGEWLALDVAIFDGIIVGLGEYPGPRLDLTGAFLLPGFIDGHLHLESSMLTPWELSRALLPRGTTAVVADPHEIANVWGTRGLDYLLGASEGLEVDFFFMLPSCVPASSLETSGASLEAEDLQPYVTHPRVLGLAEVMNFPGIAGGNAGLLKKLALFPSGPVDGHAPMLSGKALNAYRLPGIGSDHECTAPEEVIEKLRLGFYLMAREGSLAKNLAALLPAVPPAAWRRVLLVADDCHPEDLLASGDVNRLLSRAVALGLDPLQAVTLVTLNAAEYFGLKDRGAIAPGLAADLVVVENLQEFKARLVLKNGRIAARDGQVCGAGGAPPYSPPAASFKVRQLTQASFFPAAEGDRVKVMELVPDQILTRKRVFAAPLREGRLVTDPERDLLKVAVVERHHGSGRVGLGLVKGFGIKRGAFASSVAHDSHNLVVVGADEADMLTAARHVIALSGGLAVAAGGRVLADLPLPIAGLLSPAPLAEVSGAHVRLKEAYCSLGGSLRDPFMALSFVALPVIPELKITDLGLVDVSRFQLVPLFGED